MKDSALTVHDQFCGAGGSSVGAEAVGLRLRLAVNHWRRAIETHSINFPHADHVCADISSTDPRRFPPAHVLITSPECTNHSQAKTRKAMATLWDPHGADEAERSRATMMDVPRFAECHRYEIVVVENVVGVTRWAGYAPWLQYMHNLGYEHRALSINSLIAHPTPQSRDRLYVVFWKKGNRAPNLDFCPQCWCPACERDVEGVQTFRRSDRHVGKYRQQYDYRCPTCGSVAYPYAYAAASAIDWSVPTERIGDRKKPLAPATRRRVEVGLERFARPLIVQAAGHTFEAPGSGYIRAWPATNPMPAQTATLSHALAVPSCLVLTSRSDDPSIRAQGVNDPMPSQTAQQEWALATAFIAELRGGASDARSVRDPLATVTASGNHHALIQPAFFVKNYGNEGEAKYRAHPIANPLDAITTEDSHSLVTMPFLTSYYGSGADRPGGGNTPVNDPTPTVTTHDKCALVEPAIEVDDCGFRMLEPHEIKAAMAFPREYVITGAKREQVRQSGNAVTPPVMKMILERCVESLS